MLNELSNSGEYIGLFEKEQEKIIDKQSEEENFELSRDDNSR